MNCFVKIAAGILIVTAVGFLGFVGWLVLAAFVKMKRVPGDTPAPASMTVFRVRFALMNLSRFWVHGVRHPWFTLQLVWKRAGYTVTRRFCGESLHSPITGEGIFNVQSLIAYMAFHFTREFGDHWHGIMRETVGPVVFDVGSNMGQFGNFALSMNPCSRIVAVDPWRAMHDYNWRASSRHTCAVGASSGSEVTLRRKNWTATTVDGFFEGTTDVCVADLRTIDEIWAAEGKPKIAVMKIDVDGLEWEALAGAREALQVTQIVIVEINDRSRVGELPAEFTWSTVNRFDWVGVRK